MYLNVLHEAEIVTDLISLLAPTEHVETVIIGGSSGVAPRHGFGVRGDLIPHLLSQTLPFLGQTPLSVQARDAPVRDLTWRNPLVRAAAALFLLNGLGYAALASRLPELQHRLGLTDPQLGVARAGFVVGITAMMFLAPRVVRLYRAQRVAPIAAGLYLGSIGVAGAGFGTVSFAGLLLSAGALNALVDIGQNVIAVRLEKVRMTLWPQTRPNSLLSPMEGIQAVGVTAGSGFGLATAGRVPLIPSFVVLGLVGLLLAAILLLVLREFDAVNEHTGRDSPPARKAHSRSLRKNLRAAYPRQLLWLTTMSFSALLLEGLFTNWTALLVTSAGASPTTGSLCLTVFAAALFLGRSGYSLMASRLSRATFARVMGVLLMLGIAALVTFPSRAPIAVPGAAMAGLGLANLHPFCTATVGHAADTASEEDALGRMNRVAYTGIALESLLIGGLTALIGLNTAIAIVGLLGVIFIVKAPLFHNSLHGWGQAGLSPTERPPSRMST